jgi:hypothetical protein
MDSIRKEIEDELKRTRLDKTRLYTLLLKVVDNCGAGGPGGVGPQGEKGECKCTCAKVSAAPAAPAPAPTAKAPVKKVPAKKKVVTASVV